MLSQAVMRVCVGTQAHIGVKMAEEKAKEAFINPAWAEVQAYYIPTPERAQAYKKALWALRLGKYIGWGALTCALTALSILYWLA